MRSSTCLLISGVLFGVLVTPRPADASCVPGFDYGAFGKESITMSGGGVTDSYNSTNGAYGISNLNTGGNICTNGTGAGAITLTGNGTTVQGDVCVGNGGSPGTAINTSGGASYTGSGRAQDPNEVLPSVVVPVVGTNQGSFTFNSNTTLAPNQTYGVVKVTSGTTLTLNAGTYVFDELTLTGNSVVRVGSGPILVYIKLALDLSGGTVVNSSTKSTDLVFMVAPGASTIKITGGTSASYAVYAPDSEVTIAGGSDLYGAVVGKSVKNTGGSKIHYDAALGSFGAGAFPCPPNEIARSSPVVALLNNTPYLVQGTFEQLSGTRTEILTPADIATFSFPYIKGHMRARLASTVSTTASSFRSGTILFDAGATGKIPPRTADCTTFNGSCRQVFTNTNTAATNGTTWRPTVTRLNDANASAIGALIAPASIVTGISAANWLTIVRAVLNAKLGGVDRSTVAVIEPSTFAGASTRPTMAYFGAADGMLHAVCATAGGQTASAPTGSICPSVGTELWAFMPRVQLPLVRTNTSRVDGSVRVADVFGDFTNNPATGTKTWRTILTFQTGFAVGAPPAVYSFDITDPANPVLLWEHTRPTTPGATELGTGLTLAMASPFVNGQLTNLAVAQTSNGGTGGTGVVAVALKQETGEEYWKFGHVYPSPPRGVAGDLPLAANGIPGGAVGVDLFDLGFVSDFVMGDLYGNLWRLNAIDGTSRNGTDTPLFTFSTNKHPIGVPPAIYRTGGTLYAAFASGGYADPISTSWADTTQYLIAVKLSSTSSTPVTETTSASSTGPIGVNITLTSGDRGFSQAIVVGTQLFVTSDSTDVSLASYGTSTVSTGRLYTVDLVGGTSTTTVIRAGAGTLANSGSTLYSSSSSRQERLVATATTFGSGEKIDFESAPKLTRNLWLRSE